MTLQGTLTFAIYTLPLASSASAKTLTSHTKMNDSNVYSEFAGVIAMTKCSHGARSAEIGHAVVLPKFQASILPGTPYPPMLAYVH